MSHIDKNPFHPSALRLKDIHPGRRVVHFQGWFNPGDEVLSSVGMEILITSEPYVEDGGLYVNATVTMSDGDVFVHQGMDLTFFGVACPYPWVQGDPEWKWDSMNGFLIDADKRHLLPA